MPGRKGKSCQLTREQILVSVDESLKRLETPYIDLLQLHWPDRYVSLFGGGAYDIQQERDYVSFEEQLRALEELVKAGKVRYIGVSNETPYGVMKFTQTAKELSLPKIVSIQNSYSVLVRSDYEAGTPLQQQQQQHNLYTIQITNKSSPIHSITCRFDRSMQSSS